MNHISKPSATIFDQEVFSETLFMKLKVIQPALELLEIYEFRYALQNLTPSLGWDSVKPMAIAVIEQQIGDLDYYSSIQLKPKSNGKVILEPKIVSLSQMLFVGFVIGDYPADWIQANFYFDVRGFYFLHRTNYFPGPVVSYLGEKPYRQFPLDSDLLQNKLALSYKDFKQAHEKLDQFFIDTILSLVSQKSEPMILGIAGPTAAGKTEIVERLTQEFMHNNLKVCTIEMDNFLTDRDYREEHGIDSLGKQAMHFDLLIQSLQMIRKGQTIQIPQYDFIAATSSHDLDGNLKNGATMLTIEPADIVFMEGNFPFLYSELADLIDIKTVYLTSDEIRLKRKWRRDMDFRKKYDLNYFRNRYFREQIIMAQEVYIPQMLKCDFVVDTSAGKLWAGPQMKKALDKNHISE